MKLFFLGMVILGISFGAQTATVEKRTFSKLSASAVQIIIETKEKDKTQASLYVDGRENELFIASLLKDKDSSLSKLKTQIEKDFCPENKYIDGCGEVTLTKEVRTAFSREGWLSGNAVYTFFVGFTTDGSSGQFFATHQVTFSEKTLAQTTRNGTYAGIIIKTIELGQIKKLEDNTP